MNPNYLQTTTFYCIVNNRYNDWYTESVVYFINQLNTGLYCNGFELRSLLAVAGNFWVTREREIADLQLVILKEAQRCRGMVVTVLSDTTSSLSSCPGTLTILRLRTRSPTRSTCSSSMTALRT